ncbi:MAG: hypothetical protein K2X41_05375 [Hyphomicrobium sp.]|nr:hypothetical protein [Hyphomicrobium sp.]
MNAESPDKSRGGAHLKIAPPPQSSSVDYPEQFLFRSAELKNLDYNQASARVLAQICDILMLFETSCAQRFTPATEPVAHCSVFILDIVMKIIDEGRRTHRNLTPSNF